MQKAVSAGYLMSVEVGQADEIVLILSFTFPKSW
jgi:hypothetical protein